MPAYKYWRKIGLEHEIADISLQLEGQGESLKQNKKLKGQSLKFSWKYPTHDLECNGYSKVNSQFCSTKTDYGIYYYY
jgi:hypothetical protein